MNKRNRFALDQMDLEFALEILEDYGYQDLKLTNKRKMILATLLYINGIDEKDEDGYFYVENSYLCQIIGMSEPALIESLKYFNSIGIISRISGKRGSASLYKFNSKNFSNKIENLSNNFSDNFSNKVVDNQVVKELRTENLSNNFSKNLSNNFSNKLKNFSTDIDIEEDKDIDKEIEIKKDIELNKDKNNINNILINYILNLNNIINNLNNNILYIKEKNNKKEKEIEELNFKVSQLIERVENNIKINNKENFEINMKKENLKENITPSQDALEVILAKLTSIESRITSIEDRITSMESHICAVTDDNTSSNIITPQDKNNATEANYVNPMEIAKAVFAKNDEEIEQRNIPTFVDCDVKVVNQVETKDTDIPTKAFRSDLTASNDVSGTIVPQDKNNATEAKEMNDEPMSDEEWDKFCKEVDSKSFGKKNITRDVMGTFVPCSGSSEGWINGEKKFNSMDEIDKEIAVWKGKGLDIMQIATRFKVDKETFTMTDKLYSPSKVSNQIDVNLKKEEENITPSEVKIELNKVTEVVAKVNKDSQDAVVEKVNNYTEENVYYAKTNTAKFERENDNWTSTEDALDAIFSSDFNTDEEMPMSKLKEEMARRKSEQAVEVPF